MAHKVLRHGLERLILHESGSLGIHLVSGVPLSASSGERATTTSRHNRKIHTRHGDSPYAMEAWNMVFETMVRKDFGFITALPTAFRSV